MREDRNSPLLETGSKHRVCFDIRRQATDHKPDVTGPAIDRMRNRDRWNPGYLGTVGAHGGGVRVGRELQGHIEV